MDRNQKINDITDQKQAPPGLERRLFI